MILPIYDSAQLRDTAHTTPAEGETVLVHDHEFFLGHSTTHVVKLMSFVDGAWIEVSIWAPPETMAAAMGPMPEGAGFLLGDYEPPPVWDGEPPEPLPRPPEPPRVEAPPYGTE